MHDIDTDLVLMCKDKIICYYNKGFVHIVDKLPYDLYLTEDDDFDSRINNVNNFQNWCSRRMLTLDREHAKVILNSVNLRQAITDADRMLVSLQYKCLSLQDCYWVKHVNDKDVWKDINLFQHSLNEAVPVALQGKSLTLENVNCIAQDVATNGVAPKAWVRVDSGLYLYKGDVGTNSVEREVEASYIIRNLAITNTVKYIAGNYKGETVSVCPLYTNAEISLVSLEDYVTVHDIKDHFTYGLKNIILAAYIVGDSDRHCGNVFLEYNPDNNYLGVGPMLDFNHAFEVEDCSSAISLMAWNTHETLSGAVKRLFKVDELKYKLNLAEMYADVEPDNKYWKFAIQQLKKIVY